MAARIFSFLNAMVTHRFLVTLAEVGEFRTVIFRNFFCRYTVISTVIIVSIFRMKKCSDC